MIVQCPSCSTGFNLPDKHITPKGAKLRCSKCNHVFRVRRVEGAQEIQFFYKPEDEESNIESGTHMQSRTQIGLATSDSIATHISAGIRTQNDPSVADADEGNSTSFGFGQRPVTAATSKPAASENVVAQEPPQEEPPQEEPLAAAPVAEAPQAPSPFGNTEPAQAPSPFGQPASEPADDLNPFQADEAQSQDDDNPATIDLFDGDHDPFADVFEGLSTNKSPGVKDSFSDLSHVSDADFAQSDAILKPSQPRALQAAQAPVASALGQEPSVAPQLHASNRPVMENVATEDIWEKGGQTSSVMAQADSLVDDSFGQEGQVFDAAQGIVEAKEANIPPRQTPRPPGRTNQQTLADTPSAKVGNTPMAGLPSAAGLKPQAPKFATAPAQEVWPSDIEAPLGAAGKSPAQKLVNTLFILGMLGVLFFGFVASQNNMHLDFLHFGDMVKQAFGSGTYSLRKEWKATAPPTKATTAPTQAVIRPENVWVESVAQDKKNSLLVLRGQVRNFDQQDYVDVKVRGVILNQKEKILQEKTTAIGTLLSNDDLAAATSAKDAQALIDTSSKLLKVDGTLPFTIVFDTPADPTTPLLYRIELAKHVGSKDLKAP